MQIIVRDNNVEQALRALKKKLQREGVYREMKLRRHYEKPSEKRARERAAAIRRARKLERKRAEREGTARNLAADNRMSVAEAAHRPAHAGRAVKLWLGFLIIIAAGIGLAWIGAQSVRGRTVQVETLTPGSGPLVTAQDGVADRI